MAQEPAPDPYLAAVQAQLAAEGFEWEENVASGGSTFRAVAKRSRFAASRFGFEDRWFLFGEFAALDAATLAAFSTACFGHVRSNKLNPLPRGLFRSVTCFGVALAGSVDPAAAEAIRKQQPEKHWSALVFPVVFDRGAGALYTYEQTPVWGGAYFGGLRKTAQKHLTPR